MTLIWIQNLITDPDTDMQIISDLARSGSTTMGAGVESLADCDLIGLIFNVKFKEEK
jgi:hypothetical protein